MTSLLTQRAARYAIVVQKATGNGTRTYKFTTVTALKHYYNTFNLRVVDTLILLNTKWIPFNFTLVQNYL